MNKTTHANDVKKIIQRTGNSTLNQSSSVKTKNFYKTMIKPGAISSQSFVQTFDNCSTSIKSGLGAAEKQAARFNSQTPRNDFTSPDNHHA